MSKACTSRGRRFFAPEVIQTSAMDCGPAALKSLLEGFGVSVSYGRLREACQTDVDGTSIDTLEEVAAQLGLDAQQTMLPPDYLLHEAAKALPAIVVVRKPNGATHFVVVWRRLGPFVQVMDPASGTNWQTCEQFLGNLYVHTLPVSVELWREWAASDGLIPVLRHRLRALGASDADSSYIKTTFAQSDWQPLAALDSATRLVSSLVTAGGLKRGSESLRLLDKLFESAQQRREIIPEDYWCALPCPPTEGGEHVLLRGAVLIRVGGLLETEETPKPIEATLEEGQQTLSPELAAALQERPRRPGRELLSFLLAGGWVTPTLLVAGAILLGVMSAVDAVLLRSLLEMGRFLRGAEQHLLALSVLLVFFGGVLGLEGFLTSGFLRLGRHLEARLRKALQEKIPRLGDRYFHSRPTSDMAERSHSLHLIRVLPHMGGRFIQCLCELLITTAALIWISPSQGLVVLVSAAFAIGFLLAMQAPMMERDMRLRSHAGALSRNYLEALLGLTAVRTHGAERALRREHDAMLSEWVHAGRSLLQLSVGTEALQLLLGFGFAAWLVLGYVGSSKDTAGTLLLAYWALNVPLLAQQLGQMLREYPPQRNVTLRLIEPMGALEEPLPSLSSSASDIVEQSACNPVSIEFKGVSVRASGHLILEELDLRIEAGSHVALVGPSGAGKSSLVGLLLGWHRAACG
ncbi:MAG TPA: cysteine peptidase family C39 domain-containing protein, partial [Archangium sp.]|uniref:cysteine peptidase family C39 domain-containing protein n=1 Tax=Archangium sp. TaxID=1872627 RepID=UPI002ED9FB58